jgi:ligand-binding sensor domain-containing protein
MRILLLLLSFLFIKIHVSAQEFYFKNIGTEEGIPSSETYQCLQDKKGFLWFTTDAGICKYDGKKFIVYTRKDGLPENVVFFIHEDRYGRIWFNTINSFLFYYDKGKFTQIEGNNKTTQTHTLNNRVNNFFIGENDTLFFVDKSRFISKIPPQGNYKNIIQTDTVTSSTYF